MKDYLLGIATIPAVAAIGYGLWLLAAGFKAWFDDAFPVRLRDTRSRTSNAAALLTAGSVIAIRLPFGVFLAWRSITPWGGLTRRLRQAMDRIVLDEDDQ